MTPDDTERAPRYAAAELLFADAPRGAAPTPRVPPARFTWGMRVALLMFLAVFGVVATAGRVPADGYLTWRVVVPVLAAGIAGAAAASSLWAWAAQPRLPDPERLRVSTALTRDQKRLINRALRRRNTPLTPELHSWARARVAAAASTPPLPLLFLLITSTQLAGAAGSESFPRPFGLALQMTLLVAWTGLLIFTRHQQRNADLLDRPTLTRREQAW